MPGWAPSVRLELTALRRVNRLIAPSGRQLQRACFHNRDGTTENTEDTERSLRLRSEFRVLRVFRGCDVVLILADDALDFDSGVVPEVHEQRHAVASGLEVVVDLRPVVISEFLQRLELDHDLAETDEVGLELGA